MTSDRPPSSRWLGLAVGFSAPSVLWLVAAGGWPGGSRGLLADLGAPWGSGGVVVQSLALAMVFAAPQCAAWAAFRAGQRGAPAPLAAAVLLGAETLVLTQLLVLVLD